MALKRLVLFDIDGTLLWPDGAGRASMKAALEKLFGTAGDIDSYHFAGNTDRETVFSLMSREGFDPEEIELRFRQLGPTMEMALRDVLARKTHNIRPCPGALELIGALSGYQEILLGLVTGNLKPTATLKLEAVGFDPAVFKVGAFGELSAWRADLPPHAVKQAYELTGARFGDGQTLTVGDTPADVTCGQSVGARSIAVMTGWTPRPEMEAAGPDYLFDDLSDTQALLAAILAPVDAD